MQIFPYFSHPFSQSREQGLLFFMPVCFFFPSALYFYSNRETSAQVGECGAASSPRLCEEGRQSPRCGASWAPPALLWWDPRHGHWLQLCSSSVSSCLETEQGLELGSRHTTSLAPGGLLNPGPRFQQ